MSTNYWINVISRDHVKKGIQEGITQSGHGKIAPLKRMHKNDWVAFYSPKTSLINGKALQAFTAIAQITNEEITQMELSSTFKPFRRKATYFPYKEVSIVPLIEQFSFIKNKKRWGFMFRFGLVELTKADFKLILYQMVENKTILQEFEKSE